MKADDIQEGRRYVSMALAVLVLGILTLTAGYGAALIRDCFLDDGGNTSSGKSVLFLLLFANTVLFLLLLYRSKRLRYLKAEKAIQQEARVKTYKEMNSVAQEKKYRDLFEYVQIPILSMDLHELVASLEQIRTQGVTDLIEYFQTHPEENMRIASSVKIVQVNSAALHLFEAASLNHLITNYDKLYTDDSLELFQQESLAIWNHEEFFSARTTIKSLSGKIHNVMISFRVPHISEDLRNIPLSVMDITNLVHLKHKLKSSEQHARMLLESANVSIWTEDAEELIAAMKRIRESGVTDLAAYLDESPERLAELRVLLKLRHANSCAQKVFKATTEKELIDRFGEINTEQSKTVFRRSLLAMWNGEKEFASSVEFRTLEGDTIYCVLSFRFPENDDMARRLPVTIIDVSEVHFLEEQVHEQREDFKTIVENAPMGIVILNNEGTIKQANRMMCTISGYSSQELQGMGIVDGVPPQNRAGMMDALKSIERKGEISLEIPFLRKDGGEAFFELHGVNHSRGNLLCFFHDVTEERRIGERLLQSEKMQAIGQLAGGIAHDFNNQMGGILGFADLLQKELQTENPQLVEYTEGIITGIEHASELTAELLAFSRKGKYQAEVIDINTVVTDVIHILSHSIDKRIALKPEFHSESAAIKGDQAQIQNALLNLALNARDAISGEGEIVFKSELVLINSDTHDLPNGSYVKLSVSDTGSGIPDSIVQRIFEPFFTTKEKGQGTGMGLAAVYGTVKNHNGSIEVESEDGRGTTFTIMLPAIAEVVEPDAPVSEVVAELPARAQIMVVDDEPVLRKVASRMLEASGFSAVICADGLEAIDYYRDHSEEISMVVMDLVMPQLSGGETFRQLKEIDPAVKVLLASGYSIDGEAQTLIEEGAAGFIQKPFRADDLVLKINEILHL